MTVQHCGGVRPPIQRCTQQPVQGFDDQHLEHSFVQLSDVDIVCPCAPSETNPVELHLVHAVVQTPPGDENLGHVRFPPLKSRM